MKSVHLIIPDSQVNSVVSAITRVSDVSITVSSVDVYNITNEEKKSPKVAKTDFVGRPNHLVFEPETLEDCPEGTLTYNYDKLFKNTCCIDSKVVKLALYKKVGIFYTYTVTGETHYLSYEELKSPLSTKEFANFTLHNYNWKN